MKLHTLSNISYLMATAAASPVCIIGAGPAGLAAAHALEDRGREVIVFDKQGEVGGKCQAYYDQAYHPLGALLFGNATYPETIKIIEQTNVIATPLPNLIPERSYDWETGAVTRLPNITTEQEVLLLPEIKRYTVLWTDLFEPINDVGYREPIPRELTIPTLDWLTENKLVVLPILFNQAMVVYGYGDIRQTPIFYMLQYLSPNNILAFAGFLPVNLIDFHEVFVQWAESIDGDILLNSDISSIDRSGDDPIITYTVGSDEISQQTCADLILAFPPTVAALEAANLDLSDEERDLFASVGLTEYFASAVSMSSSIPANNLFVAQGPLPALPPIADGQPVGFERFFENSDVVTVWSWGTTGQNYTIDEVQEALIETLSRLNKDPDNPNAEPVRITEADIKAVVAPDYFPSVSGEDLAAGWYQRLDRQQGQRKTYFASGLNAFETVEFSVRAGYDVVETYL